MIRDAQGKLAITPGVWEYGNDAVWSDCNGPGNSMDEICYMCNDHDGYLIAEAGTVTNATGRTPAELRDLARELRDALDFVMSEYVDLCDGVTDFANRDAFEELLKKSEGV
jgi:hypothetical protein